MYFNVISELHEKTVELMISIYKWYQQNDPVGDGIYNVSRPSEHCCKQQGHVLEALLSVYRTLK